MVLLRATTTVVGRCCGSGRRSAAVVPGRVALAASRLAAAAHRPAQRSRGWDPVRCPERYLPKDPAKAASAAAGVPPTTAARWRPWS